MNRLTAMFFSLFLAFMGFYGCKKQETVPSKSKTSSEIVNQEVNQTAPSLTNHTTKEALQTKRIPQKTQERETKDSSKPEKVLKEIKPDEKVEKIKPVEKMEIPTEKVTKKTEEALNKLSCLKCHGNLEKLSEKILPLNLSSGVELANYLRNVSTKRAYHKNLSDSEIIKAYESISLTSKPSKKIEGC